MRNAASKHRDKRHFQPAITSFFARDDRDAWDDWDDDGDERGAGPSTRSHTARGRDRDSDNPAPSLPAHVQSNLLNVGMRVRKSVPEGYKTGKTMGLPTITTTIASGPAVYSVKPPTEPVPDAYQHQRELLPFCGLSKIGGFAEQPTTNMHLYGGSDDTGERAVNMFPLPAEAFNQPFSSQSSAASSISTDSTRLPNPMNPNKRSYEEDDDRKPPTLSASFPFAFPLKVSDDETPVSPLTSTPSTSINSLPKVARRPFAQPKTRRHGARMMELDAGALREHEVDMEIENAEHCATDFEDADFLRYNGQEVEMAGV